MIQLKCSSCQKKYAVGDQHDTVQMRANSKSFEELHPRGRLQRGKPKLLFPIPRQNELHEAIAKIAHAIEKNDRTFRHRTLELED